MESPHNFNKSDDPGNNQGSPQNNPKPWEIGYKILGRYEILDIKKGGMGIVYIAHDHEWNQKFAVKTFQDQFLWNENIIQRFMAEAEVWTNLERHTNIVFSNFVKVIEGKPLLFLEYIDGGDLNRFIGKLGIAGVLDFAIQFCTGMEYAYRKLGVIHRDIKPGNVMVQKDSRFRLGYCFKISDFGLVKALGGEFEDKAPEVSTGMGTSQFMSPEQFPEQIQMMYSFSGMVTTRSDIYAFGVTLYLLLTGKFPFNDLNRTFMQYTTHPKIFNPAIPEKLDTLIVRCLEKNPDKRYSAFGELQKDLMDIFNDLAGERYAIIGKKEALSDRDWVNKGVALATLEKYPDAVGCYDRALEINPGQAMAWCNKGNVFLKLKKYEDAIGCYNTSLTQDPGNFLAWTNKGAALADLGNYQDAIGCYEKALIINPGYFEAWSNKGTARSHLGKKQDAIECYDHALALNQRVAEVWYNKGLTLNKLGKYLEAIECYDRAIKIDPKYSEVWNDKGNAFLNLKRYQDGIGCYEKSLKINPGSASTWSNKGSAFLDLDRHQDAIHCYDKALAIDNGMPEAWYNKGLALSRLGRFEEAVVCYSHVLEINPGNSDVWNKKGNTLMSLGKYLEAVECYKKGLEFNPENPDLWFNRGIACSNLGMPQDAIGCFGKFIGFAPSEYAPMVEQAKQLIKQLRGQ